MDYYNQCVCVCVYVLISLLSNATQRGVSSLNNETSMNDFFNNNYRIMYLKN